MSEACSVCSGRGFLIIPHESPEGHIEPNEVQECGICNGTGEYQSDPAGNPDLSS